MSKRLVTMLLAGVAALAVLGGCGGGGEDDQTDQTTALTKAQFIEQADAICTKTNEEYVAEYEEFAKENGIKKGERPSKSQNLEVAEAIFLPNAQVRLEALQELDPPGKEEEFKAFLKATEEAIAAGEKSPKKLYGREYPFAEAQEIAGIYGFRVCSLT